MLTFSDCCGKQLKLSRKYEFSRVVGMGGCGLWWGGVGGGGRGGRGRTIIRERRLLERGFYFKSS